MPDWVDFLARVARRPRSIGAITPSGRQLARLMAAATGATAASRVLELGPGTGAITRGLTAHGIAPQGLTLLEFDPAFAARLRARFPHAAIVEGNAFDPATIDRLGGFDAIVSGIPLLNFPKPQAAAMIEALLANAPPGAPFVQFSYGAGPPIPASTRLTVTQAGRAGRNLPPAKVWVYRLRR